MSLKLKIDVPEGYVVEGYPETSTCFGIQLRDMSRRTGNKDPAYKYQLTARIFETGKVVLWLPGESRGFAHSFKTYDEARTYVETILRLGMIYENMPDIFTRS